MFLVEYMHQGQCPWDESDITNQRCGYLMSCEDLNHVPTSSESCEIFDCLTDAAPNSGRVVYIDVYDIYDGGGLFLVNDSGKTYLEIGQRYQTTTHFKLVGGPSLETPPFVIRYEGE